jgi:choline dehydrogenase-like flavoprotein
MNLANLRVETSAHAIKIALTSRQAIGGSYLQGSRARFAKARREVLLYAGVRSIAATP